MRITTGVRFYSVIFENAQNQCANCKYYLNLVRFTFERLSSLVIRKWVSSRDWCLYSSLDR